VVGCAAGDRPNQTRANAATAHSMLPTTSLSAPRVYQIRASSPPAKVGDEITQITSAMVEVARRAGSRRL
jgi:hypothetical protein